MSAGGMSKEQIAAVEKIKRFMDDPNQQVFRFFGGAGTGKTTVAVELPEMLGNPYVIYAAPTGKAASVLRRKGAVGCSTVHKLIYTPKDKSRARLRELELEELPAAQQRRESGITKDDSEIQKILKLISEEKDNLSRPFFTLNSASELHSADLLVLDEMSMIDGIVGKDLLSFNKKIIAMGDPFQLPPPKGSGFFLSDNPDVLLNEIHRQARESPIISLAHRIRTQRIKPDLMDLPGCRVVKSGQFDKAKTTQADQVLVGRNATRHRYNNILRQRLGIDSTYPIKGDRLVCLRNNNSLQIYNGTQWVVARTPDPPVDDVLVLDLRSEDDDAVEVQVVAHAQHFDGRSDEVKWPMNLDAEEFAYGYVLTVHKSQGSQWDSVIVLDESEAFRADASRWLYTAVTRAAKDLTVIQ